MQAVYNADPRLRKAIYLTTYDPDTVEWFKAKCAAQGWSLQFTEFPRWDKNGSGIWTYVSHQHP